jgi:hypothetical protein
MNKSGILPNVMAAMPHDIANILRSKPHVTPNPVMTIPDLEAQIVNIIP